MILFLEKIFMCEDKGMGESTPFVSGFSCHFPGKYRKLENNFLNACQSHFFLLPLHLSCCGWLALRCWLGNESPWLGLS